VQRPPENALFLAQSSSSITKILGWRISGRLERAKTLFASTQNGDLAAVIATIAAPQLMQRAPQSTTKT